MGKSSINGSFSMAMLNNQRVINVDYNRIVVITNVDWAIMMGKGLSWIIKIDYVIGQTYTGYDKHDFNNNNHADHHDSVW